MFCMRCNHQIGACTCPDREERMKALQQSPRIALTFCSGCGEYITRCKCPDPKPPAELRSNGKVIGPGNRP